MPLELLNEGTVSGGNGNPAEKAKPHLGEWEWVNGNGGTEIRIGIFVFHLIFHFGSLSESFQRNVDIFYRAYCNCHTNTTGPTTPGGLSQLKGCSLAWT